MWRVLQSTGHVNATTTTTNAQAGRQGPVGFDLAMTLIGHTDKVSTSIIAFNLF
jgi:hypothetical protein